MTNKSTALIGSILVTALFASNTAIANQASITIVGKSVPISTALDAELFPTDQSHYTGAFDDRVNYSMESTPISAELEAELFPDHSR